MEARIVSSCHTPICAYHAMTFARHTAFTQPLPTAVSCLVRTSIHPRAIFPSWNTSPFRRPFLKAPRPNWPSSTTSNGSTRPPANSTGSGGASGVNQPDFDRSLFASNPELEQLALKSNDAPVLIRVVSYNVLSSSLASPSYFTACDPANLNATQRLKRVLTKLEGPVASRSIICLQEVSLAWSGPLHTFFADRGFHLVLASHGSYFGGYMGEGLAFPLDLFEPIDLRIERLTDLMEWPVRVQPTGTSALFHTAMKRLSDAWDALTGSRKSRKNRTAREPWDHARGRLNRFIFARLRSRTNGAKICVGTYHMPCIYWSPPVMLIHSALVVRTFQRLCGTDDGVLAGDFNIKPSDSSYKMIVTGKVDSSHQDFPPKCVDGSSPEKWFPVPLAPMKSAYKEVLGTEPDFTNYAKVEGQPMFIETLDYVFCTEEVDVVDVMRLPHRSVVQGPFPDASEPSDHVMIGATLRLQAPTRPIRSIPVVPKPS